MVFVKWFIIEYRQQFPNKFYLEINKKQLQMENIINSRLKRNQSPTKLENMSPQKFGKSAFAALTYTPSKLVDNVLFREVTTFKKIEQESSKVRQSEAFNGILKDRLNQLVEERNGIESTLTQQVQMYKKMLNQNQVKHQQRVRAIQKIFSEEMQKIILTKQQEAKFSQSEKELLQARICQLQNEVGQLKSKLQNGGNNFDQLSRKYEKLQIHYKNACQKLEQTQNILKEQEQHSKAQYEELSRKLFNTEVEFKGQIDKFQLQKQRGIQSLQKFHRVELQKVENKRLQQATIKNEELKDLATTFQGQANRLNDIITSKERNIDNLNSSLNEEKQKILNLTKDYTTEITNLVHEKGRLKQEIDSQNNQLATLKQERKNYQVETQKQIASLEVSINKLQDQLELTHLNYIREKDKTSFLLQDLNRQITELKLQNSQLKSDNQRLSLYPTENNFLSKENRNLKDLLLESSLQLEKCKEEFMKIGREKDHLVVRVRELGYQNENLHRLRVEKEEEARGWRQSYYLSRR